MVVYLTLFVRTLPGCENRRLALTGPVRWISPHPENYEKIYYIGSKAPSKTRYFYSAFGLKTAAFSALYQIEGPSECFIYAW